MMVKVTIMNIPFYLKSRRICYHVCCSDNEPATDSDRDGYTDESDAFESSCEMLESSSVRVNPHDSGTVTPVTSAHLADEARADTLLPILANKFTPLATTTSTTQESRKRKAPASSPEDATASRREKKKARKQRKKEREHGSRP